MIPNSGNWTISNPDIRGFYTQFGILSTGWYRIRLHSNVNGRKFFWHTVEFGVGDVYFVAGQSNASGYPENAPDDNVIPYTPVVNASTGLENQNIFARVLLGNDQSIDRNTLEKGLPIGNKFEIFSSGNNLDPKPIYPNGVSTWYWNKLAKELNTPVLFFNIAKSGSGVVNAEWSTSGGLRDKFLNNLQFYGNILGAKAVLWHQGEADSQKLTLTSTTPSTYLTNYKNAMISLINDSRAKLGGSSNLNWFVSKVSYITGTTADFGFGIGSRRSNPLPTFNISCKPNRTDITEKEFNTSLTNIQEGLTTNSGSGLPNVFLGVNADDNIECERASKWGLHFSGGNLPGSGGNSLNTIATEWKTAIQNANPQNSISPLRVASTSVSKTGSSYQLTINSMLYNGGMYYWVKGNQGIDNATSITTTNSYTFVNPIPGEILSCYIKTTSSRFYTAQPFVVPGGTSDQKVLTTNNLTLNFASSANDSKSATVTYQNVAWDLNSVPAWITTTYDDDNSTLTFTTNQANPSTTSSRTVRVYYQEQPSGISAYTDLNQAAATTPICLPNNNVQWRATTSTSGNWQINQAQTGGSLKINNQTYAEGLSIQVNGSGETYRRFNIGSTFTNFTGSVGRDDAADGCGCGTQVMKFVVKNMATGVALWTSVEHGINTPAECFSINVTGVSEIGLYVEPGPDGIN